MDDETPTQIASQHNMHVHELLQLNKQIVGLKANSKLHPGTELRLYEPNNESEEESEEESSEEEEEAPFVLPRDWKMETKISTAPSTKGMTIKKYISPDGKKTCTCVFTKLLFIVDYCSGCNYRSDCFFF